ncbi:hypothetical protein KSF73_08995 [Burkholderiaceae bacterium DAT-1]|nr:hypothetical protein [Burkholderiaceae bacterium DAT-1]
MYPTLIASHIPPSVLQRLVRQGFKGHRFADEHALPWPDITIQDLPAGSVCWLTSVPVPSRQQDSVLWFGKSIEVLRYPGACATLHLQDHPFAAEFGFACIVGGTAPEVAAQAPILNALAPFPGAWFHAGDRLSADFMAGISGITGAQIMQLGQSVLGGKDALGSWLANHQQASAALQGLAEAYLATQPQNEAFKSANPLAAFSAWTSKDSPACQLARSIAGLMKATPAGQAD